MSGGGKGGGESVIGFKYYFGIHMGLGRGPVDEIVTAKVGDLTAWQGSITSSTTGRIKQPELFGGEKKEGGIDGNFDVLMGESTQDPTNAPVASILTPNFVPGFRRMLTIYYDGLISALNPYPKKWAWRVRRAIEGWDGPVFRPDLAIIILGGSPPAFSSEDISDVIPYNPPRWLRRPVPLAEGHNGQGYGNTSGPGPGTGTNGDGDSAGGGADGSGQGGQTT